MSKANALFRHLPFFIAVARTENFRRAALHLGIAQPALSRRIHDLEAELGTKLFERDSRGVRLSGAGRMLFQDALEIAELIDRASSRVTQFNAGYAGILRVGFTPPAIRHWLLPEARNVFNAERANIDLHLSPLKSRDQLQMLRDRILDIAIVYHPHLVGEAGLNSFEITTDDIVLGVAKGHRLASRKRISVKDLTEENFILLRRANGASYYDHILEACLKADLRPTISQEVADSEMMLSLVSVNAGICFAHSSVISSHWNSIVFSRVNDLAIPMSLALVWRNEDQSPVVRSFIDIVRTLKKESTGRPNLTAHGWSPRP